jgi:hypothetical protein
MSEYIRHIIRVRIFLNMNIFVENYSNIRLYSNIRYALFQFKANGMFQVRLTTLVAGRDQAIMVN